LRKITAKAEKINLLELKYNGNIGFTFKKMNIIFISQTI